MFIILAVDVITSSYQHDVDQLRKFMAQLPDADGPVTPMDSGGHETTGNYVHETELILQALVG